ncbi:hypothetical protein XELAEV_18019915mg [Xenopus laevis]|uniref:Uncharacterized protein n=1 Tax=Xenopus laevis TaxID=8355 RepID=A0A974HQI0_XENLA|nr:hypothetical protein XELAEV_18019915mg [Xenopus laevis]
MSHTTQQIKSKIPASRRILLKTLMLQKATEKLEKEKREADEEKTKILDEKVPSLQIAGLSLQELQELCTKLHKQIDSVDEERYDIEMKVKKHNMEEKAVEVTDWRKNIEAMSGMEGRKKKFDTSNA